MSDDRWRSLEQLYQAALDLPASQRAAFLKNSCSDERLRSEVESLLGFAPAGDPLLKHSPWAQSATLEPGTQLGPYRIEECIGSGGMGEVYKARDTRLGRDVALKVLAAGTMDESERRERFIREAQSASRLNHPNIVTIYDIGEQNGKVFIAMEYLAGKTLNAMIPRSGLPLSGLLKYAIPIASALAKAHAAGIIHRDLKPGNIMITSENAVKVLDFGLAKLNVGLIQTEDATETAHPSTQAGIVMGTPAFMSPEQAEGKAVDARSDIFSFGAMLYEMATGIRAFRGDSAMSTMAAVLTKEPEPPPSSVPPDVQRVILRCLKKDPERRFQNMADVRVALEELREDSVTGRLAVVADSRRSSRKISLLTALGVAAAILALIGIRVFRQAPQPATQGTVKFTITPAQLSRGGNLNVDTAVFISGDGKHIAYVESPSAQLWIRDLDQEQARPVPGATGVYEAFWSPDDQSIGYSTGPGCSPGVRQPAGSRPCDLVRIPAQGGTPVVITKIPGGFRRASWSSDGQTIVYCDNTGMYTVPAAGGSPSRVPENPPFLDPSGAPHMEHPSFVDLPGGRRAILFQAVDGLHPGHGIYIQLIGESRGRLVITSSSNNPYPAYSPTGHIVYNDGSFDSSAIWALPFSLATLQPTGKPFPIAQHGSSPRVSRTGTLVYSDVPSNHLQLLWSDRSGKTISSIGEPVRLQNLALSPDGRRLAIQSFETGNDMWMYDLERGVKTRFTFDSTRHGPSVWAPTGDEITYAAFRNGNWDIFSKPSNGSGDASLLVSTPLNEEEPDWSPDQRFLMYVVSSREAKSQLVYRERRSGGVLGEAVVFLKTPFSTTTPRFSPDGRFVAFVSDESGKNEIYVRDFPKGANQWQVSSNGGTLPRWRRDGKEMFYVEQSKLMAVSVTMRPTFLPGPPVQLFENRFLQIGYDVSADGKRFVILARPPAEPPLSIHVVHNWFEEFRAQRVAQTN